jgi:hypothetical protein
MAKRPRNTLITIFRGNIPPQAYADLIESTLNIMDDGVDVDEENGFKLSSRGSSRKLMSFYEGIADRSANYSFELNPGHYKGLSLSEDGNTPRLFVQDGGNLGIGTQAPAHALDVRGLVAMEGRVGSFAKGYVPADGSWHTILRGMDGCQAFEAMAHINDPEDGRFALSHAFLLMSSGKKGGKTQVRQTTSGSAWFWGRFWNKIVFRWRVDEANSGPNAQRYELQMRTRTHYGMLNNEPKKVFYRLTKLWDRNYESDLYEAAPAQRAAAPPRPQPPVQPQPPVPPSRQEAPPAAQPGGFKIKPR